MECRKYQVLAVLVLSVFCRQVNGTTYFVSPTGSDSHNGTSASPWLTLQHAADVVHAGDFVTVATGNYTGFDLETSGTAAAPIEFFAQPGVVINQRNATTPDGINLEGASYVTIDGFTVNGMPRAGVRSVGDSDALAKFVTVRHVTAANNGEWGIFTGFVDDLLIESNTTSGSVDQHGIYVSNSGDRPIIRNNISFNNHDNGIHMNGDASQGGDGIITGAVVTGNIIYNNGTGGGSGINMDGVQNSVIANNLLYNNHASGISLYKEDGGGSSSGDVVANNTIIEPSNARWDLNIQNGSTSDTVRNNILLNNNPSHGAIDISPDSLSGFSSDYNVVTPTFTTDDGDTFLNLAQWQATGNDTHSFATAVQLFANSAANDYHLNTGSPAVNAGTSFDAAFADLEGGARPAGGIFDIGAYELGALVGDFNRDGVVDTADYVLWRNSVGATVTRYSGADGDGSGVIDQADYAIWRSGFGVAAGAGSGIGAAAVPEPTWVADLCVAMALLTTMRRVPKSLSRV
ncbi:MAG TPA: right-handed parallel beta-helix repeat-containing protein [Lacipirellulaceae bacterium]|nr:right-handed parallel beta-helix repeat-containing protein [Lacipirellulaceae bacterium]